METVDINNDSIHCGLRKMVVKHMHITDEIIHVKEVGQAVPLG